MKTKVMRITMAAWITVLALLPCLTSVRGAVTVKKATLDQGTVQMLSNILESLDAFRNDRLRDLEKIRLSAPAANGTKVERSDTDVYLAPNNSSVSEHIRALKEGILGHNPVKKTFGYKVTVYTSPIGEDGKDGKPVMVTQYVGGDIMPDKDANIKRKGEIEDLEESANHPEAQRVQSSESIHIPVHAVADHAGSSEDLQSSAKAAESDHNRKTEHSAFSDNGHQNAHSLVSKLAKGHDHEKHSAKHDEHHKETEKESHRHDEQQHDKGGASQQGIRERTEIEYYEREHFLDTEYDKAKTGHEKTNGLKEHEKHNDHDSHESKRTHEKEDSSGHKLHAADNLGKAAGTAVDEAHGVHSVHYVPPYGSHHHKNPHLVHADHHDYKENHQDQKEGHENSKHHLSEEDKGHKEHNSEKDHHSEQKDSGYLDKDKGRRKEGYRERGYKITAEREYFLNDAHHDKGKSTHTSGARLKDQEGAAHGHKEGERDRGFVKEEKAEEAHDAAYDTKERKYYDGEAHKEEIKEEKSKATATGEKAKQEEIVPVVSVNNYLRNGPKLGVRSQSLVTSQPMLGVASQSKLGINKAHAFVTSQPWLDAVPQPVVVTVAPNFGLRPSVMITNKPSRGVASKPVYNNSPDQWRNLKGKIIKAPIGVNYLEPHPHHLPYYPAPPIAYAPSDDGAQAVIALPPADLKKIRPNPQQQLANNRRVPDRNQKHEPIGGFDDDDYEDYPSEGYVGHAGYRKRPQSPLVSSIKENVKKDVHRKPPTYSKPQSNPEEENSVRFPESQKDREEKYEKEKYKEDSEDSEEASEEVIFPQDEEKLYRSEVKYNRNPEDEHVYPLPKNAREQDLINLEEERHRNVEKEKYQDVPNRSMFQQNGHNTPYPQLENNRHSERYQEGQQNVYTPGIQSPEKLLRNIDRNAYPQIQQTGKLPTVSEILEEVTRFPQRKPNKPYLEAHQKTKESRNQQFPDLRQFYHLGAQAYQRGQRNDRNNHHLRNAHHQQASAEQHQQGHVGNLTPLIHLPQNQQARRGLNPLEQLQHQQRQMELLQQQQNQRNHQQGSRDTTPLEQLQQQTKPPFSPVVLLSRGPPAQNQAVDVWYTRQ